MESWQCAGLKECIIKHGPGGSLLKHVFSMHKPLALIPITTPQKWPQYSFFHIYIVVYIYDICIIYIVCLKFLEVH